MQRIIDVTSEPGKQFLIQLYDKFPKPKPDDKLRQIRILKEDALEKYSFLTDVIKDAEMKDLKLNVTAVEIGHYGRKVGWNSKTDSGNFRIVMHLGSPEAYYYDNHVYALMDGYGFILSPLADNEVSVSSQPVQVFNHQGIQSVVPKIRPRNYLRTTLVYTLNIELNEQQGDNEVEQGDNEEVEV